VGHRASAGLAHLYRQLIMLEAHVAAYARGV
jgi:hypothetical protein